MSLSSTWNHNHDDAGTFVHHKICLYICPVLYIHHYTIHVSNKYGVERGFVYMIHTYHLAIFINIGYRNINLYKMQNGSSCMITFHDWWGHFEKWQASIYYTFYTVYWYTGISTTGTFIGKIPVWVIYLFYIEYRTMDDVVSSRMRSWRHFEKLRA